MAEQKNENKAQPEAAAKKKSGWLSTLVDYGPVVVFLGVYKYMSPSETDMVAEISAVISGTGAFIIAALAALTFSKLKFGKVSPMLWLSTGLIVFFGALTIFFRSPTFIQWKPTIIYLFFGGALLIGCMRGKALLQTLLEVAFEGVDDEGWLKLSRNWGLFFLFLAVLNTVLLYFYNVGNGGFETWLWAKFWIFMPMSFLFTFSQIPMLLRHGLSFDDVEDEEEASEKE